MSQPTYAVQFGKVRINSLISPNQRILTSTHRISAFDCVLPLEVENKGHILQAMSVFFFANTRDIIQNHFLGCLDAQTMLVKSGRVLPLEVIARGALAGSLWRSYKQGGASEIKQRWGVDLPEGLKQHHRFEKPLITFTTKAAFGHDELVTPHQAIEHVRQWLRLADICTEQEAPTFAKQLVQSVTATAEKLFTRGQELCAAADLLLMDTKYEFALDENNQLMLVDEIHTPDASRFVDLRAFELGRIDHFSKEWLREEIQTALAARSAEALEQDNQRPFVLNSIWSDNTFKTHLAAGTAERYRNLFERLFPLMQPWDLVAPHLLPWPVDPVQVRRCESQQRLPERVLVVGNGGRDYTLAQLLERQPEVDVVYCWPGRESWNGNKKFCLDSIDTNELLKWCRTEKIGWAVFGPEMPIAQGLAEKLRDAGVHCLAPDLEGARLEVSKIHTKKILNQAGCPTAESWMIGWEDLKQSAQPDSKTKHSNILNQYPYVLKYESLAAGKGVCLIMNAADLQSAMVHFETNLPGWLNELDTLPVKTYTREIGEAQFLVEKLLPGKEISAIALCHGEDYALLPFAQDFKRRNDHQTGPNTGGMGAVCPVPLTVSLEKQVHEIFKNTLRELRNTGTHYRGFLFAGLMLDAHGNAQVLEYNCRMGDPESQVILPGLGRDLILGMWLTAKNEPWNANPWLDPKNPHSLKHDGLKRCFVVVASPEYPETSAPTRTLLLPEEWPANTAWIPSGVDANNTTRAGRIAGVLAVADSEDTAVARAYIALSQVAFKEPSGMRPHFRTDISFPGFKEAEPTP
jgi:phosphoribosylamine--glycine ligase